LVDLRNENCLDSMKSMGDYSVDLIVTDPPYALGSEVIIKPDGKPDYKKAVDFMNRWSQPDGKFWEEWFKEANRILKYGGRVVMFGMDRQCMLNKYYACYNGFIEQQSLYWYFLTNFPKSTSLSKQIEKSPFKFENNTFISFKNWLKEKIQKDERNIKDLINLCGFDFTHYYRLDIKKQETIIKWDKYIILKDILNLDNTYDAFIKKASINFLEVSDILLYNRPDTSNDILSIKSNNSINNKNYILSKKYEDFRYSISPLKQTNETIMVFQKPYKNKSCLHDTLAYEDGDSECCCGALDIENNRVPISGEDYEMLTNKASKNPTSNYNGKEYQKYGDYELNIATPPNSQGRYPAQTFIDSGIAEVLDKQSGDRPSWKGQNHNTTFNPYGGNALSNSSTERQGKFEGYDDNSGCSKILHKCDYDEDDYDIYYYSPKVNKKERNLGCEKNNHPTLKPIKLLTHIIKLFKTPNPQVILDPFMGSGTTGIVCKQLDIDFIGIELDKDYFEIAENRINSIKKDLTKEENCNTIKEISKENKDNFLGRR